MEQIRQALFASLAG